ncbi:YgjP-like metallopeptidase domain-containing protein [Halobacillus litoralis]|uniref:YgjP-like metallopeptidase domain-containing protein n=1 Tax=Halobacillus litoralis TaxID=45668 RepID=UPI001CD5D4AB|nr:YgjP-like metallopeptidase domain-containing protein [Halobacillus litoralis]MCA1023747.1 M48 family metallopeptidase [Halobacillus litoralis]
MPLLQHNETTIQYTVHKQPKLQFTKIYLDDLNGVQVTAPEEKSDDKVQAFVEKKADWIIDNWQKTHADLYPESLSVEEGQKIIYLGRAYRVLFEEADSEESTFSFQKGKFQFRFSPSTPEKEQIAALNEHIEAWLREKAAEKFKALTKQRVTVEDDVTRLGSRQEDAIALNWRLIHRKKDAIQTVIEDIIEGKTY